MNEIKLKINQISPASTQEENMLPNKSNRLKIGYQERNKYSRDELVRFPLCSVSTKSG